MNQPLRVLHFADTHIGMENYGRTDSETGLSSRVVDFLHRMDEMVAHAREQGVDLVVFAGDAFKTRAPGPTFQREFAWRVRDLSELAPVVLLVGNHDLPPTALKASSIEIYETLAVPNVYVAHEYDVLRIETGRGPVIVGTAPYPIRSRLMQQISTAGLTIAETDAALQRVLVDILQELAARADTMDPDGTIPRLLTAHFSVDGAVWSSERSVMLGRDVVVPLSIMADPRWDYVALGHIHKHQNLTANRDDVPPVVYSGSLERIDFGEEGDPKGFCMVELARGAAEWRFVQVAARPFVTLRCDCRKKTNPTQEVLKLMKKHRLQGAVVRLVVQLTPETEAALSEGTIRDALRQAGVFQLAAIHKDVERPVRARLGGSPEGLTHIELLRHYLASRDIPAARQRELLAAAEELMQDDGQ